MQMSGAPLVTGGTRKVKLRSASCKAELNVRQRTSTLSAFEVDSKTEAEYQIFKSKQRNQKDAPCTEALIELALAVRKLKPDWFKTALRVVRDRTGKGTAVRHCAYRMRGELVQQVEAYAVTYHAGNGAATSAELLGIGLVLVGREARLIPATVTEQAAQFLRLAA